MKMKNLTIIALLCIASVQANAQLLWKISGNGLKEPSYIFGSHHMAPLSITDSIEGFKKAFESTRQLYGEVDFSTASITPSQETMKIMMMPEEKQLSSLYSKEDYNKIDSICKQYLNMDIKMFNMTKPMVLALQLEVIMYSKYFPDALNGKIVDMEMQKIARENGKPVKGLETMEFQMNVMFNMPLEEQAAYLLEIAGKENCYSDKIKEISDAYMSQDINKMEMQGNEEFIRKLVYDRNHNWVEQFRTIMPQTATFFVVGAGHLPGKKGMIELLRNEGYTVEAVW